MRRSQLVMRAPYYESSGYLFIALTIGSLAEERILSGNLEVLPFLLMIHLRKRRVFQLFVQVILIFQIFDNRAGLHREDLASASYRSTVWFTSRTSHSIIPVLGSSMVGTSPLGQMLIYGSCFISLALRNVRSKGISSSFNIRMTFHGCGPLRSCQHQRIGFSCGS